MLLKCTRENETTYYLPSQIRKLAVSPVYGKDDAYDVCLYVNNNVMELIGVYPTKEEAEKVVLKLYDLILHEDTVGIIDLSEVKG